MKNLVSVIIPCYNAEQYIERTIKSILSQSYQNFEIIAINDGSIDNTLEILEYLKNLDIRILILNQENSGVSKTRNRGLDLAKGEFICFLDADDCWETDFLKASIETIISQDLDYTTTKYIYVNENDELLDSNKLIKGIPSDSLAFHLANFTEGLSVCPSAYLYKTESIKKASIRYCENLQSPEDRHWLLQVAKNNLNGILLNQENCNVKYRVLKSSLSHSINLRLIKMQEKFLFQVLQDKLLEGKLKKIFIKRLRKQLIIDYIKLRKPKKVLRFLLFS